jgi:hypothetical protein
MKKKYILTKEQVIQTVNERWFESIVNKYKNEFKLFFINLKKQFKFNANARRIILTYMKTKKISNDDQIILKIIITDSLKMVGLGGIVIPIPGGVVLVTLLISMSKKFNIDILPSQFEKEKII